MAKVTDSPIDKPRPASPSPESVPPKAKPQTEPADPATRALEPHTFRDPPLIAVYKSPSSPPVVVTLPDHSADTASLPRLVDYLSNRAHTLAREQGSRLPLGLFRELVENLVHASFEGAVITILDGGNTVRVSDKGPGIPDKDAALRPGFTSADASAKRLIRGVGSGFSIVKEIVASMDGVLEIEDNLGHGTVVTAHVPPVSNTPLAPAPVPSYNLSERQLRTLLLTVELAPTGPTLVARELGVSTSTAYRDLVSLEEAGFVVSGPTGLRSVTDTGLAYLNDVL
jgi:anti-sigma regulatory factor (Ser/Thr protein kinase)